MLFVITDIREESYFAIRSRLTRERESIGRELVTSAANGDVENCRLILKREESKEANNELTLLSIKARSNSSINSAEFCQSVNHDRRNYSELLLTNFVSSGHTSLQAAAQNGHVDVCRMLIGEFDTNVEYQVQTSKFIVTKVLFSFRYYIMISLY